MEPSPLLKHLDAELKFLSFTMTDLILYLMPLFLGLLFDSLLVMPLAGLFATLSLKRLLKKFPRFYGIRSLYWSLPTGQFNRIMRVNLPPSNNRFWIK